MEIVEIFIYEFPFNRRNMQTWVYYNYILIFVRVFVITTFIHDEQIIAHVKVHENSDSTVAPDNRCY